ncbi:MAG: hypothetical protein EOP62_04980 [Sphingomonadales bacterium]|nr:MAG: hypothetical protein EOP62_04980 [Sphingomonadales bacterium]
MRWAALGLTMLINACGGGSEVPGAPANGIGAVACDTKPDFVPVYADAQISVCTATGTEGGQQSGTIIYTTAASPKLALSWSRAQANASGLGQRMMSETMYSAGETTRRSLMVLVEPEGSGTRVTVNWGSL